MNVVVHAVDHKDATRSTYVAKQVWSKYNGEDALFVLMKRRRDGHWSASGQQRNWSAAKRQWGN